MVVTDLPFLAAAAVVLDVEAKSLTRLYHPQSFSSNAAASKHKRARMQLAKFFPSLDVIIAGHLLGKL